MRCTKSAEGAGRCHCSATLDNLCSWQLGEVPEDWRKVNGIPVFKMGKKEDTEHYRPVSLILIPGKVIKQLILETISRHVKEKEIIRSSQHAFTKRKSCLTNLINFYNEMIGLIKHRGEQSVFST